MHTLTLFGCITLILVVPTQELSLSKATITEMYNQAFLRRFPSAPRLIKALFPNYKGKYIFNLVPLVSFRFVLCTVVLYQISINQNSEEGSNQKSGFIHHTSTKRFDGLVEELVRS